MTSRMRALLAVPVLAGLVAAPIAAHADWHRGGYAGWHRGGYGDRGRGDYGHYEHRRGIGPGGVVAGALLGLGAAAVVGSVLAPPAYYAPRPYYAPPPPVVYAPPPVVYAPPPAYYAPPGYYPN